MTAQPMETSGKSILSSDLTKISSSKLAGHKKLYKWLYPVCINGFLSTPVICTANRCHWSKPSPRLLETQTKPLAPMAYTEPPMSRKIAMSIPQIDPLGLGLKVCC